MPTQGEINQVVRLLKKLIPKALRWWKKRQASTAAAAGGGGHQQQQQQQSYSGAAAGSYGGSYPQQQPGSYGGQPGYGGQQSYQQGPPPQQQGWGPPQHQQQSYQQPQQQGWGGAPVQHQYMPAGGHHGGATPQPSFQHGQTDHFGPHGPSHQNQDQVNASNANYVQLRNDAIREGDLMRQAFDAAHNAHQAQDGGRAKQLSNEGHEHQRKRDQLNDQAADWIFRENNKNSPRGTIDLHGLFVQEAITRTEAAVQDGQRSGLPELRVITGKGLHSTQHVAKIKPAIEELMVKYNLGAHIDPHNTGVLIVNLQGGGGGGSRDLGFADQLANQAEGDKCTIM